MEQPTAVQRTIHEIISHLQNKTFQIPDVILFLQTTQRKTNQFKPRNQNKPIISRIKQPPAINLVCSCNCSCNCEG